MPRKEIEPPYRVEYLSILDEQGNLDAELEPDLPQELLLRLYRTMLLARRLDERMFNLQRQGRIGTFAPITGQEASQIAAVAALRDSDWMVPSFREMGAALWRGQAIESLLLYYGGYYQGGELVPEAHNLPVSIPVGTQIIQAPGIGYAIRYRGRDDVVMVFFGDGATSEGDFHEGMNFAAVFQAPVIFVCQNNQWAISVPRTHQTRSETLAQKALAYGMPGIQVDGNDVLAVYVAAREAVDRARAGRGPTMIECITYRLSLHTTADDPTKYRSEEEVRDWQKRDPIPRYQKYLLSKGLLSEQALEAIDAEVKQQIQQVVERTEERMEELSGRPETMFDHLYAEKPPELIAQQQEFMRDWSAASHEEGSHA